MSESNNIVKNSKNALYTVAGVFGVVAIYKIYKAVFPNQDPQITAGTDINPNLSNQSQLSDTQVYSLIDELIGYINPPYFGTYESEIFNFIDRIGIVDFAKVHKIFGKKLYNTILGEVILSNNFIDDNVFPRLDLKNILLREFGEEDANRLREIYNTIENI